MNTTILIIVLVRSLSGRPSLSLHIFQVVELNQPGRTWSCLVRQKSSDVITPCVAHHKGFHLCQTRRQRQIWKQKNSRHLQSLGQSVGPSSGRIPTRSTTSTPPPLKLSSADPSRLSDLEISLHRRSRKCFKHTALEKVNRTSFINLRMPSVRYHAFHVLNLPCMIFLCIVTRSSLEVLLNFVVYIIYISQNNNSNREKWF